MALILLCSPFNSLAQNEGLNWYFGQNAGIRFEEGGPVVVSDGELNSYEGCASISSSSGELLFYTDGVDVWNREHNIMPGGLGLGGSQTSTQSALIIKQPASESIYFIFTTEGVLNGNGLKYSVVDMMADSSFGEVISKNKKILSNTTEKLLAIRHENERDFWILTHQLNNDLFFAYLLGPGGLSQTAVISKIGSVVKLSAGYLKASSDGSRVAAVHTDQSLELMNFNPGTGKLSNPIVLDHLAQENGSIPRPYGVEFSPNGSFLYLSQFGSESKVSQFSLLAVTKEEIEDSEIILYSSSKAIGALLLAPDFKIYVSKFNSRYLDLIENPDVEGLNCNYQEDALYLNGRKSSIGLPNFNNAYLLSPDLILYENYCLGEETRIYVESTKTIDSIHYTVFDGANRIMSNAMEIIHIFSDIGEFMVEAEIFFEGKSKVLKSTVLILDAPVLSFALDTTICESRTVQYFIQQAFTEVIWNGTSTGSAYSIREEGNYFIELKNACGEMRESFEVEQTECLCDFYVPSAFSPNADGLNESFKPVHSCDLSQYELLIYNRWGELLFTTQASHVGWNGRYEEVLLPSALYIYVIYYTSRGAATKQLSGMVYLYH